MIEAILERCAGIDVGKRDDRNVERAQHHIRCLKKLGYNTFAVE